MIPRNLVEQIQKLLNKAPFHSNRDIGIIVGVSTGTVSAIANGTWNGFDYIYEVEDDTDVLIHHDPPVWCSACGTNVYSPCQVCLARLSAGLPTSDDPNQKLELELNEDHRERYKAIRALRAEEVRD